MRDCLVDPVYLAIYKDPVSVTLRRHGTICGARLARTTRWMAENIAGINKSGLDVHWLSYSRAVARPERFVHELAKLAGMDATQEQIDAAVGWICLT